jgi:hypothetical protein
MCSGSERTSSSISGTCHVTLVTNPVLSHELGKDRFVITTNEHICGYLWHRYSEIVNQFNNDDRKTFKVMPSM